MSSHPINVAVLDDYQGVATSIVDWSSVSERANITVFRDHLADQDAVAERLAPFDVVCIMRERTPMAASLLNRLPKLKLIASTGPRNASIDLVAAAKRGILIAHTGYISAPTIELTWALILASAQALLDALANRRIAGAAIDVYDVEPLPKHHPYRSAHNLLATLSAAATSTPWSRPCWRLVQKSWSEGQTAPP
jgi:lactate dehydrogenase-like 2-hydroxyacid dehydrogenase